MGLLFILDVLLEISEMMTIWDETITMKGMEKPSRNAN